MDALLKSIGVVFFLGLMQMSIAQSMNNQPIGSWMGKLDLGSMELRLGFNISVNEEGDLRATLDSPDQGANGIPLGEVTYEADSIRIAAPNLNGYYLGAVTSDSTIEGIWNQNSRAFPLSLKKSVEAFVLNRPQEPLPPLPYREEEIVFENLEHGFSMGGTVTIPEGEGPFPATILVSGSGSQNRDEELFGHKPFKVIADHLTRRGIMVLRYDDRGVGASGGGYAGSTPRDHAVDAKSAMDYLLTRKEIDPSKLGVIGHSEGGMIAFMLASKYQDIAFVVSLAGPGVDGKTILLEQSDYINRLSGVSVEIRDNNRIVMNHLYELMISKDTHREWRKEMVPFIRSFYSDESNGIFSDEDIDQIQRSLMATISEPSYNWLRFFASFEPANYITSIQCPVLALNGEKDCQVLAEANIEAIRNAFKKGGNQQVVTRILPGLNHLFQNCDTGLPGEYGSIEETFDESTLILISEWILEQSTELLP